MNNFEKINRDIAWCPGCGNFLILKALKEVLQELGFEPKDVVLVSGIGQAAKTPQYVNTNYFNGLHGRAIPAASGIKVANKNLKVIVISGDGDIYGEGGNHFLHAIRRNSDITVIVGNNMVYGLTKGQSSPTSDYDLKPKGNEMAYKSDFNPISAAIALDCAFVSRSFCQNQPHLKTMMKEAINHKGFSLLDVFSPCVTFNITNTYDWFKNKTYELDETHNPADRVKAFEKSLEKDKLPIGIFYRTEKPTFEENEANAEKTQQPLYLNNQSRSDILYKMLESYK